MDFPLISFRNGLKYSIIGEKKILFHLIIYGELIIFRPRKKEERETSSQHAACVMEIKKAACKMQMQFSFYAHKYRKIHWTVFREDEEKNLLICGRVRRCVGGWWRKSSSTRCILVIDYATGREKRKRISCLSINI
jgi:hypothetical protein